MSLEEGHGFSLVKNTEAERLNRHLTWVPAGHLCPTTPGAWYRVRLLLGTSSSSWVSSSGGGAGPKAHWFNHSPLRSSSTLNNPLVKIKKSQKLKSPNKEKVPTSRMQSQLSECSLVWQKWKNSASRRTKIHSTCREQTVLNFPIIIPNCLHWTWYASPSLKHLHTVPDLFPLSGKKFPFCRDNNQSTSKVPFMFLLVSDSA